MQRFAVGELYNGRKSRWPDGAQYAYRAGVHDLVLFLSAPTEGEVRDIRKGEAEFALGAGAGAIVLLCRFGSQPWTAAPYSWHLVPEAERGLPQPTASPESRALVQVTLVEAGTGIVRAHRSVSWSATFTAAIHSAIRIQAAAPWDPTVYDAELAALSSNFDGDSLVLAAIARTKGGEDSV